MQFGPARTAEESLTELLARDKQFYARWMEVTADDVQPADYVLMVELPRTCWGPLEQAFGRPLATPDSTRLVSLVLLLIDFAESTGGRVYEELLYDDVIYAAASGDRALETVRRSAVVRYRYIAVFKHHQLAAACQLLTTRFASDGEQPPVRSARLPPAPGPYCCTPYRFMNEQSFRSVVLQYSNRMSAAVPGRETPAVYDVPRPAGAAEPASAPVFVGAPNFDSDDDDDDEPAAPAAAAGEVAALPPDHLLYPLQLLVQAALPLLRTTHEKCRLSQTQSDVAAYLRNGRFDPPAAVRPHMRRVVGGWQCMLTTCLGEFRPDWHLVVNLLEEDLWGNGVDMGDELAELDREDVRELHRGGTVVERDDTNLMEVPAFSGLSAALTTGQQVIARKCPDVMKAYHENRQLRPFYRRGRYYEFVTRKLRPRLRQLFRTRSAASTVPPIFYAVFRETHQIELGMRAPQLPEMRITAAELACCSPRMGRDGFCSWQTKWYATLLRLFCGLTDEQALLCEFIYGSLSRSALLLTDEPSVVIAVLGGYGIGKSRAIGVAEAHHPAAAHSRNGGTFSGQAHHRDQVAVTRFADEHDESTETRDQRRRTSKGWTLHSRNEQNANGAWGVRDYEFLARENIVAASNTAMTEAMASRATEMVLDAIRRTRKATDTAKDKTASVHSASDAAAASACARLLNAKKFELCEAVNIGGLDIDASVVPVMLAVFRKTMPKEFDRASCRLINGIQGEAIAQCISRVSALWHMKVKHECSRNTVSDMLLFYTQKCVVSTCDAIRAFLRRFLLSNQHRQEMDMAAAVRLLIEWEDSSPVPLNATSTRADDRYIQLSLPIGHERDPLRALLDPGIGPGVVQSGFNKLKGLQHGGLPVLTTGMSGKWAVSARYIFQREIVNSVCREVTSALIYIVSNAAEYPGVWQLSADEEWLVLNMQARNIFLDKQQSTLPPPPSLRKSGLDRVTIDRELHAMALSGALRFRVEHEVGSCSGDLTLQTVVAHDPAVLPLSDGVTLSEAGGGCEKLLGERKHLARGRPMLGCLALNLDWYMDALASGPATDRRDDALDNFIRQLTWIDGSFRPGEKLVWGIAPTGSQLYSQHTVQAAPPHWELTLPNPNRLVSRGPARRHTGMWPPLAEGATVIDAILPKDAEFVTFTANTRLGKFLEEGNSQAQTGEPLRPMWRREACEYAATFFDVRIQDAGHVQRTRVAIAQGVHDVLELVADACGVPAANYTLWAIDPNNTVLMQLVDAAPELWGACEGASLLLASSAAAPDDARGGRARYE